MSTLKISSTEEIIHEIRQGRMVILVDEEDRENEGDLVLAAQFADAQHINFMAKHGRGLICLTLTEARCQQLNLPSMVEKNGSNLTPHTLKFTCPKKPLTAQLAWMQLVKSILKKH